MQRDHLPGYVAAIAAVAVASAGFLFALLGSPSVDPAGAQFDTTTTEEPPPSTTILPTTTTRAPTTTTAPPATTQPPATTTSVTRAPASTSTTGKTTSTTRAPANIPTGPTSAPVTSIPFAPEPGDGSMAWWVVALSPIGLGITGGVLATNWLRSRDQ